ncbi:MAG: hypothetical protein PHU56_01040 [Candidatus Pacebacteria bacterium]|nr:hypothetical protein [Candidatus Paceibacterota bacterium]
MQEGAYIVSGVPGKIHAAMIKEGKNKKRRNIKKAIFLLLIVDILFFCGIIKVPTEPYIEP